MGYALNTDLMQLIVRMQYLNTKFQKPETMEMEWENSPNIQACYHCGKIDYLLSRLYMASIITN